MDMLYQMVLMATVMIVFIILLRQLFLYRLPKRTFQWLWLLVLLRLFLPVSVSSPLSVYSLLPYRQAKTERAVVRETAEETAAGTGRQEQMKMEEQEPAGQKGSGQDPAAQPEKESGEGTVVQEADNGSTAPGGRAKLMAWLSYAVWLAGSLGMVLYFLINHFRAVQEFRTSLPVDEKNGVIWLWKHPGYRDIRLRQSDRIRAPLTYGVLRPVILMPSGLDWSDAASVEAVLLHELCHIRHLDVLFRWLLAAALCIYWWDPFIWVMFVLAGRDMELACDEEVVKKTGDKKGYAQLLLSMQLEKNQLEPVCSHFSRHAVTERIRVLVKGKTVHRLGTVLGTVLVAVTASAFWTHSADAASPLGTPVSSPVPVLRLEKGEAAAEEAEPLIGGPLGGLHGEGGFYEDRGYSWLYGSNLEEGEEAYAGQGEVFLFPEELTENKAAVSEFTALGIVVKPDGSIFWQDRKVRVLDDTYASGRNRDSGYYYSGDTGEVDLRVLRDYSGCTYDENGLIMPEAPVKEVLCFDLSEGRGTHRFSAFGEMWETDGKGSYNYLNPTVDDELRRRYQPLGIEHEGYEYRYQGEEVRVFVDLYELDPRHVRNSNKVFTLSKGDTGRYDIVILRDYDTPGEDGYGRIEGFRLYDLKKGTVTFVYTGSMQKVRENGRTWFLPDSEGDLLAIGSSAYPLDGSYRLQKDVVMTSEWSALGTDEEPFTGEFDGGGHTISNLTVTKAAKYVGMFGKASGGAWIHDLTLDAVRLEAAGESVCAGVCLAVDGARTENIKISLAAEQ